MRRRAPTPALPRQRWRKFETLGIRTLTRRLRVSPPPPQAGEGWGGGRLSPRNPLSPERPHPAAPRHPRPDGAGFPSPRRRQASDIAARRFRPGSCRDRGEHSQRTPNRAFRYANQALYRSRHAHRPAHGPRRAGSRRGDPVHPSRCRRRRHRGGGRHRLRRGPGGAGAARRGPGRRGGAGTAARRARAGRDARPGAGIRGRRRPARVADVACPRRVPDRRRPDPGRADRRAGAGAGAGPSSRRSAAGRARSRLRARTGPCPACAGWPGRPDPATCGRGSGTRRGSRTRRRACGAGTEPLRRDDGRARCRAAARGGRRRRPPGRRGRGLRPAAARQHPDAAPPRRRRRGAGHAAAGRPARFDLRPGPACRDARPRRPGHHRDRGSRHRSRSRAALETLPGVQDVSLLLQEPTVEL